ncbi:MAG: hypothetical protein Q7U04_12260 [Bacteriovorax sp.]|nr:hypothetical protein [Bacteriovorax sp.]
MMTKVNFEETFEIYLFTDNEQENNFSKLNEFLSFLKYNRVNLPYKFSYVGRGDGLIPELTLNENILMDFSPDSLTAAREFQFQEFLKARPNPDLEKLYKKIGVPHELPTHTDAQMRKVSSLIKSLIYEGQFIFLEAPEKDLDEECLALFISSLKDNIERFKQNVFIFSTEINIWMPHVHQHVKREQDYSFSTLKINKNWAWNEERNQFFAPAAESLDEKTLDNELIFHLPKSIPVKKSAA